jgi:hypothetical protein
MRFPLAVVIAFVLASSTARADENVGVVVTGDPKLQPDVTAHVEVWLKKHGHTLVQFPLPADAINAVANCLVIDDQSCARKVVEARAKPDSVVFVRIDVAGKNVTFTVYWFVKQHEPISEKRVCEKCGEDAWRGLVEGMMTALAGASQVATGHLKLVSRPSGMIVLLDNQQIGVTPLERDLAAGSHTIKLTHAGRVMASREVEIRAGELNRISMKAEAHDDGEPEPHGSRLGPALLLIAGIGALGTGGVYLYYGQKGGPNEKYVYPDSTPVGIGVLAVGIGATIGGAILLAQSSHRSAPVAAIGNGGAYLGWITQF